MFLINAHDIILLHGLQLIGGQLSTAGVVTPSSLSAVAMAVYSCASALVVKPGAPIQPEVTTPAEALLFDWLSALRQPVETSTAQMNTVLSKAAVAASVSAIQMIGSECIQWTQQTMQLLIAQRMRVVCTCR